jgi:hypothetical protein
MNNYYYSDKYRKYLNKNMSGGVLTYSDIVRYTNLINSDLGRNWCYTGSIALYLYCEICGIPNPPIPNDIDIVYVPDSCRDEKPLDIAGFVRNPAILVDDGLPYYDIHGTKMLDLICEEEISYYETNINGDVFKLLSPEKLLDAYRDRLWDFNNSNLIIENKIRILEQIVLRIDKTNIQKYRKPSRESLQILGPVIPQPNFFDDDD